MENWGGVSGWATPLHQRHHAAMSNGQGPHAIPPREHDEARDATWFDPSGPTGGIAGACRAHCDSRYGILSATHHPSAGWQRSPAPDMPRVRRPISGISQERSGPFDPPRASTAATKHKVMHGKWLSPCHLSPDSGQVRTLCFDLRQLSCGVATLVLARYDTS